MANKKISTPIIISGKKDRIIRSALRIFLFWSVLNGQRNLRKALLEVQRLRKLRSSIHGNSKISKFVKSDNKYYWTTDNFGFPSKNLTKFVRSGINNDLDEDKSSLNLLTIIWGITNRCPLKCKHCYDWDNIDDKDQLNLEQLEDIMFKIIEHGIHHVQISGGEPLSRFNDLISIVKKSSETVDFWILTSGFGLNEDKAKSLKSAGLKGVNISLDHWDETAHNEFRNNPKSFEWVMKAVENCRKEGLMISLSLCATKEFTTLKNLESYLVLAKKIGVQFVRILEPRKVGHFINEDVRLDSKQIEILSDFTLRMNSHNDYQDFPIVIFFGYHQRKLGCFGAGNKYLYIDANGDYHACPFCQGSVGNALDMSFNDAIIQLRKRSCHQFKTF